MSDPRLTQLIQQATEELNKKKLADQDANAIIGSLQEKLVEGMGPVMEKMMISMAESIKGVKMDAPNFEMPSMELDMSPVADAMKSAMQEAMREFKVSIPEIKLPTINVPEVRMPTINIPPQTINEVSLKGVDSKNPLAVLLHGTDGKPILNFGGIGGGSRSNFLAIKNILTANGDSILDDVNDAMRVNVVTGTISATPGLQISGASDSVNVVQFGGVDAALNSGVTNSGTLRVVHATDVGMSVNIIGGSTAGIQYNDNDVDDVVTGTAVMFKASNALNSMMVVSGNDPLPITFGTSVEVKQVSGFVNSVEIASQPFTLDVKQLSGTSDSVNVVNSIEVKQVSGFINSVEIASQPFTLDVKQLSGSTDSVSVIGSVEIKQVSGFEDSVNITQLGGQAINLGAGAVGTGTIRTVAGSDSTTMIVGDLVADAADTGSPPLKIGGIARTANPTAVAAGDRVSASFDDLGRQVLRPLQVRDLIQTAYVALSTGTETTLLASAAGVFSDLIYIMGANDSGAAVQVDIRAATGANKIMTIEIPANGTAGVSLPVPIPQDVAADTWTVDMPDITGTNVYISALFSKEV